MRKLFTLVFALIIGVSSAMAERTVAEVENEVEVGMNLSSISEFDSKIGFHMGYRLTITPPNLFYGVYINAGAMLSLKGAAYDYGNINAYYLEIPVHFGYRYYASKNIALFGEFGPYLGIGLFGKSTTLRSYVEEEFDTFSDEVGIARFDYGLGFRAGVEINQKVPVSIGYDFGLKDINRGDEDTSLKNSNFTVSIGYKF